MPKPDTVNVIGMMAVGSVMELVEVLADAIRLVAVPVEDTVVTPERFIVVVLAVPKVLMTVR